MLDQNTRTAILKLHEQGHGSRAIARALRVSRSAARDVVREGSEQVPRIEREQKAAALHDEIVRLNESCKSNLVRVHEELLLQGVALSYQALTAYCRREGIGHEPSKPAGRYDFTPGEEMQHDTSKHEAPIGGKLCAAQTASVVLCYSRMLFFQLYPRFRRFECKLVLDGAAGYFKGVAGRCMIDNTHVVVLRGTGKDMVPVAEMAAFGERYGFEFRAHEKGDANRSARVEGPFNFIDNNFLAGREFRDWEHANQEARLWCDKVNATYSPKLHASRRELFAAEFPRLKPLPLWVPEVYLLHHRIVDAEGYVNVDCNRYSVPYQLIGRRMEVRETRAGIEVFEGPRKVASHARHIGANDKWITAPEHRPPRGQGRSKNSTSPEEKELIGIDPRLSAYVAGLKRHCNGSGVLGMRRLLRMVRDYPREPLVCAIATAEHYGLYDLDRLERMILRQIANDYFLVPSDRDNDDEGNDHDG
jgi:transposase